MHLVGVFFVCFSIAFSNFSTFFLFISIFYHFFFAQNKLKLVLHKPFFLQ